MCQTLRKDGHKKAVLKNKEKALAKRGWFKYQYLDSWYSIYTFDRWVAPFATMDELLVNITLFTKGPLFNRRTGADFPKHRFLRALERIIIG